MTFASTGQGVGASTAADVSDIAAAYAERLGAYDILSFDVFDTLVTRPLASPIGAFGLMRAKLVSSPLALLHPSVVDAFTTLRVAAEHAARQTPEARGRSGEVTLKDIYLQLQKSTGLATSDIDLCERLELETEHGLAYPHPPGAELFRRAVSAGKPIIMCSDMYLPSDVIREMLEKCGYEQPYGLYVSCELGASKHRGNLFELVARKLRIPASRILHVGDNAHGDVGMAAAAGWGAIHLPFPRVPDVDFAPWCKACPEDRIVTSLVGGMLRKNEAGLSGGDAWRALGFKVFGPLFTGFLVWLRRAISQRRPDHILLLARDMRWLSAPLRKHLSGLDPSPTVSYLHVSRASLLMPSFIDLATHRLGHLVSGREPRSVDDHLRRLGLDPSTLSPAIGIAGFGSGSDLTGSGDPRMAALLANVYDALLQQSLRLRPAAVKYLEQFITDRSKVMLVDVGWAGNMHSSFVRLLRERFPGTSFHGHHVGLFGSAAGNAVAGHPMYGWLTRPHEAAAAGNAVLASGGVELLEFAMRAPHGTTLGYRASPGGEIQPVLEDSCAEDREAGFSEMVQEGALAFLDEVSGHFASCPVESFDSRTWAAPFARLVLEPTSAEADLLGDLTHCDSAGDTARRSALAPIVTDPAERIAACAKAFWPAGFIVRNGAGENDAYHEATYLALHPDVREAVSKNEFESGHVHWLAYGRHEGRVASWPAWARQKRAELRS